MAARLHLSLPAWCREVVLLYETDIASGADFYTDSNGREMLKRTR